MSDAPHSTRCTVTGCSRIATTVRDGAPMCDRCAEEWETVGPLTAAANHPGPLTSALRRAAMRLMFVIAALLGRGPRD